MVIWVSTDEDEPIAVMSIDRPYHSEPEMARKNYFGSTLRVSNKIEILKKNFYVTNLK